MNQDAQIHAIIEHALAMHFPRLCELLVPPVDPTDVDATAPVLRKLPSVACLIRGVWVCRSDIRYHVVPGLSHKMQLRQEACKVWRDHLLVLLSESEVVELDQFKAFDPHGISTHEAVAILSEICVCAKGWRLKLPSDDEFVRERPDVVDEQKRFVQALKTRVQSVREKGIASLVVAPVAPTPNKTPRGKATAGRSAASAPPAKAAVAATAAPGKAPAAARGSVSDDELMAEFVKGRLKQFGVVTEESLKRMLDDNQYIRHLSSNPQLLRDAIDKHCVVVQGALVLATVDDRGGGDRSKNRELLIQYFKEQTNVRRSDVMKRIPGLKDHPQQFKPLIQEFAVSRNSLWVFKTGNEAFET
mmetsp:Transcript_28393/g.67195  ORF Transcript_28393/g.67195 Transcript_28393/m.67195 type:complete len:359 (-) Transcript_28393:27-1103(-)